MRFSPIVQRRNPRPRNDGARRWQRRRGRLSDEQCSHLYNSRILELTRAYLVDEAPKNSESHALSLMRKHVRTWLPGIRLLLAYSDPAAGHTGGIYEADGWAPFGKTTHKRGCGWRSRPNRSDDPVSPKLRWVRTP